MTEKHLKTKQKQNVPSKTKKKPNRFGERHIQAILMFLGMVFSYFLRVNVSAAVVPMTKQSEQNPDIPFYDWDMHTTSVILSSFFWGYVIAQLPSGILAKRFGPKIVFVIGTVLCAVLTVLTPLAARCGWQVVCAVRVLSGLMQGVVYPCVHTLLAKWTPVTERGFLATAVYSGAQFGTSIILAFSGVIFESCMGWPGIFFISGGIGFSWAIVYLIFGADSPETSKRISEAEKDYIFSLAGSYSNTQELPIPWKAIFTSVPFYALLAAHCGFTWGFYTLLTELPTYLSGVLLLEVRSNALLSALPYFVMGLLCLVVSPISDWLINHRYLRVTASRKIFNTIGQWVPMVCLLALGYTTDETYATAVSLLTIGVGFNSASFVGYLVNHMDLAPNFAGTMMGITNGISNLLSIFAPLVVGEVVHDVGNPQEWRYVFYLTASIYFVCNLIFIIFGSADLQKWNDPPAEWVRRRTVSSNSDTLPSRRRSMKHHDLNV